MTKTSKISATNIIKYIGLMLCVLLIPLFAGCDLVTTNVNKQLAEVAASYDNGHIEITREELIMTYNYIGNSRYDNSSTVTQNGIEQTLDLALNRAILVDFLTADDMADERARLNVEKVQLTMTEANDVWRNVYDYVNSSVKSYEDDLRAQDDVSITEPTEEDDTTSYSPYEKTYEFYYDFASGEYALVKIDSDDVVENESIALFDTSADLTFSEKATTAYNTFREKYWEYTDSVLIDDDTSNDREHSYSDEAWTDFINALLRSESDRNLSKVDAEAFLREIERVYNIYYENAILTAFQNRYTDSQSITVANVATKFKELYNAQYEYFNANPSAFDELIPTSGQNVYYMYDASGYFKVNHILFGFSDEQTTAIEAEQTKLTNGQITKAQYEANVARIKSQTQAYNRETGEYENLDTVVAALNSAMTAAQTQSAKMAVFRDFMHKYSTDTATLNAESCYYIPLDADKDTMVEEFANASRELYNDRNGTVGNYSGLVETEYGYHIIMYTGAAQSISVSGSNAAIVSQLNGYYLNPVYNKTMLDKIIEQVALDSYSVYEASILNAVKAGKDIVKSPSVYSDLYA